MIKHYKEISGRIAFCAILGCINTIPALADTSHKVAKDEAQKSEKLEPLQMHPRTSLTIVEQLRHSHFLSADKRINNELSSAIFEKFLKLLDMNKAYLTQKDITEFEKYRFKLDEALGKGDLEPAFAIFNTYRMRLLDRINFLLEEIDKGLSTIGFDSEDSIEIERETSPWSDNNQVLDAYWRKRIKAAALTLILNGKTLEEAEELLRKRYTNRLRQARQTNSEDAFQLYINAFTNTYDPHTQYFSPRTSRNFDINMSLSLEGIGAVLRGDEDYTSVIELVPAGPAQKSGLLGPADKIISVGQGSAGPLIDVVGWRLDDVVELIRGPKDSKVRLEIIKAGSDAGSSEVIEITRNKVALEEQAAQKAVLSITESGKTRKVGVIRIPTFYVDFKAIQQGNPNYRSSTKDVRRLIKELEEESVEALIIDLRNNGGGSLQEADSLTGLFINSGPTVQVKSSTRRNSVYQDTDDKTAWNGPLAVIVNRLSASASEIFAGAIQDYERGIVIGGQTFGKGTVQTLIPLTRGQLKITAAKFYRISGESTQHQGIIPDIKFPTTYDKEEIGESSLDDAMLWDRIDAVDYTSYRKISPVIEKLRFMHLDRIKSDPEFIYLTALSKELKKKKERSTISLNEKSRRNEKTLDDAWRIKMENQRRLAKGEPQITTLEEISGDKTLSDADLASDPMLKETGNILLDYILLSQESDNSKDQQQNIALHSK